MSPFQTRWVGKVPICYTGADVEINSGKGIYSTLYSDIELCYGLATGKNTVGHNLSFCPLLFRWRK